MSVVRRRTLAAITIAFLLSTSASATAQTIDDPIALPGIVIELDDELLHPRVRRALVREKARFREPVARARLAVVADEGIESTVRRGIEWLAKHQRKDGHWSFAHTTEDCPRDCRPHGEFLDDDLMATGVAMLAFLGAGQTHKEGKYRKTVTKALEYLLVEMKGEGREIRRREEDSGELGRAIVTLALTEVYAMTADKTLLEPAQMAIDHTIKTQDKKTHGWRIRKMERCSIALTAWQLMALRSAHMAYLKVPLNDIRKVSEFLQSVQYDGGATYGRDKPQPLPTAAGLLSRSYLGWERDDLDFEKKDDERMTRGIAYLNKTGPVSGNLEYNFFAHQVIFHSEDLDAWKTWNGRLRDQLVDSQITKGHAKGSWHFKEGDSRAKWGGRLYCTAMAVVILEIYYRHMPIYRIRTAEPQGIQ